MRERHLVMPEDAPEPYFLTHEQALTWGDLDSHATSSSKSDVLCITAALLSAAASRRAQALLAEDDRLTARTKS
jgi:hypothetical protein